MNRRLLIPGLALGSLALCGAHPPPKGDEVLVDAGGSMYTLQRGGCGRTRYHYDTIEPALHAAVSHRADWGGTAVAEGNIAPAFITEVHLVDPGDDGTIIDPPTYERGDIHTSVNVALRLGWHGNYFGVEAGPMLMNGDFGPIEPSMRLWFGHPRYLYLWGEAFAGPTTGLVRQSVAAGVGISNPRFRSELGLNALGVEGRLTIPANEELWLGADLALTVDGYEVPKTSARVLFSMQYTPSSHNR